jgi:hypothetical protein
MLESSMEGLMEQYYSSPALAKEMERIFGQKNEVKIQMKHEGEIKKFLAQTEEAHKKAAKSKLHFG